MHADRLGSDRAALSLARGNLRVCRGVRRCLGANEGVNNDRHPAPSILGRTGPGRPAPGRGHRLGVRGLWVTEALAKAPVAITMISGTSHHLFQPLLYQVATGVLSEGEVAPATREVLKDQANVRVLLGRVTDIDLDARTVTSLSPLGTTVTPYDTLVVAAGAGQSYFGNDQFAEFAPGMKSIDDALELRGRIFGSFELAELCTDPADADEWLTFVVVGAGPAGVEMAGQIAELAHRTLRRDFRRIDTTNTKVILLDAAPAVLAAFGDKLSQAAAAQLKKIGVDVQLNVKVVGVDNTGVDVIDPDGTSGGSSRAAKCGRPGSAPHRWENSSPTRVRRRSTGPVG